MSAKGKFLSSGGITHLDDSGDLVDDRGAARLRLVLRRGGFVIGRGLVAGRGGRFRRDGGVTNENENDQSQARTIQPQHPHSRIGLDVELLLFGSSGDDYLLFLLLLSSTLAFLFCSLLSADLILLVRLGLPNTEDEREDLFSAKTMSNDNARRRKKLTE